MLMQISYFEFNFYFNMCPRHQRQGTATEQHSCVLVMLLFWFSWSTFFAQDIRVFSNFKKKNNNILRSTISKTKSISRSEKYIAQWCEAGDERKEYVGSCLRWRLQVVVKERICAISRALLTLKALWHSFWARRFSVDDYIAHFCV